MEVIRRPIVLLALFVPFFLHASPLHRLREDRFSLSVKEKKLWHKAENHYTFAEYDQALPVYRELLFRHPDNQRLNYHNGICLYYSSTSRPLSIPYFEKALALSVKDTVPDLVYHAALAYLSVNRFEDAEKYFLIFKRMAGPKYNSPLLERQLANCRYGKEKWKHLSRTKITNLGPEVNSVYPDYSPVITRDYSMLLFTSKRAETTGGKRDGSFYYEDVYVSHNVNSRWNNAGRYDTTFKDSRFYTLKVLFGKAENVSEINTTKNDGSIGLSPDGKSLYIYRSDDIWKADWNGERWEKPHRLNQSIDCKSTYEPSCFLTADGKAIFFVSDREGGLGEKDIYSCTQQSDGSWSAPVNAGSNINTEWNEDAPYVTEDGSTLYFSSEGHESMGGYDVFRCKKLPDGSWSAAENLGAPVNNGDDDIFYVPDEKNHRAWYSTLKREGEGSLDIFQVDYFPEVTPMAKLNVQLPVTEEYQEMHLHLKDVSGTLDTNYTINASAQQIIYPYRSGATYELTAEGAGFHPFTEQLKFTPGDSSNFCLQQLSFSKFSDSAGNGERLELVNRYFNIDQLLDSAKLEDFENLAQVRTAAFPEDVSGLVKNNVPFTSQEFHDQHYYTNPVTSSSPGIVYFDFDKANIRPDMIGVVSGIAEWLKENPSQTVEIAGHTDSKGASDYNQRLSEKRARAVKTYLVEKGIPGSQLQVKGHGETEPAAQNQAADGRDNPAGRAMNRRVEIRLVH